MVNGELRKRSPHPRPLASGADEGKRDRQHTDSFLIIFLTRNFNTRINFFKSPYSKKYISSEMLLENDC